MFYWKYSFYIYKIKINLNESSYESLIFFQAYDDGLAYY